MELKPRSSNFLNGVIFAISYFSMIPLRLKSFEADDRFYRGVIYGLPIVGFLLAVLSIIVFLVLNSLFPTIYSAFLSSVFYLIFYGFLHLEAVADTIDGWYASLSKKDVYKVMKEPQVGALGAIGTFCLILVKLAVLTYLFYLNAFFAVIIVLVLSRFVLYFILELDIHEKSSFLVFMKKSKIKNFIFDVSLYPINFLVKIIVNKLVSKVGFINGDIAGFTIEIVEIILLHIALVVIL